MSLKDLIYEVPRSSFVLCNECKHLERELKNGHSVCKAFPDEIPRSILLNKTDHHYPVEGDKGIQFEPKGKKRLSDN